MSLPGRLFSVKDLAVATEYDHGPARLAEDPVRRARPHRVRLCGERADHQLCPAVHTRPLAREQAALPPAELSPRLLALEP